MGTILIVYYSKTGNTRKMADLIAEGAAADGKHSVKAVSVTDLGLAEFAGASGYAFGSPDYFTYMAGQMKTFFDSALGHVKQVKGKPFVSFVSHGGGGGAIDSLDTLGRAIGLVRVCDGVKNQGAPTKQGADACRELGRALAQAVS